MERKAWYVVAYDIADPKRLRRVHYQIKKKGISAQKSVFLVFGAESRINSLLDDLAGEMSLKEDDLRAYPILNPKRIWTTGPNPLAAFPVLYYDDEATLVKKQKKTRKFMNWAKKLLKKRK